MSITKDKYPRPTAIHEAGHAVVGWSFDLAVGAIWVSAEDASGGTQIGPADHLKLSDQIAVWCAGGIAEEVFECPGHELATFQDNVEIMNLLAKHGFTEESGAPALRAQGYDIAAATLESNRAKVMALAECLVEYGRVEASDFLMLMDGEATDHGPDETVSNPSA
ncbi:hypothetical protein IVB08_26610 [Bradyrhizobium sp. 173]|uniref:hypothetical protein n=1 Tax=Bradyrhizobium sp. 173 TaxID=2782644 RepID=UPI001FF8EF0D|nr:hypothetical protein [Bradyrhizobium sp. 173]MCK1567487.1 hypothetical protein [Bradyrhizobium sp. 173]